MHWGLPTLAGGWTKQLHNNNVHIGHVFSAEHPLQYATLAGGLSKQLHKSNVHITHVFVECTEHAVGIGHSCWGTDEATASSHCAYWLCPA